MDVFLATETLIIELLLVVSLVAIAVRRLRVPYTVALVLVGLVLTFGGSLPIELTPDLILALFVPPLIFEAAFHLEFGELRRNLRPILILAVAGVLLTTALVGVIVAWGTGLTLTSALVFGALIAATDPVAVVALFRALGAPKSLTVLMEGESLLNDGTAIVVFNVMLAFALSLAVGGEQPPTLPELLVGAVVDFVRVAAGGALIGLGLGWLTAQVIARLDDYLIETTLTTVLAFGAYLVAERLHLSGVLAVVAAGIVCGTLGLKGMSPTTRIVLFNFWEYAAFIANSLVFLLIGLDINLPDLLAQLGPIGVAVAAVLLSRVLVVYGLIWLSNRWRGRIPLSYQHVQYWGGLRGAISLALALSLPASFADRNVVLVMTFGVVLFTLLIQGTTMNALLKRLGLVQREEAQLEYERGHGRLMAARAAHERVAVLYREGIISPATWEQLDAELGARTQAQVAAQQALLQAQPALRAEELDDARREALRAERTTLTELHSSGVLSEHVYSELVTEVDAALGERGHAAAAPADEPPPTVPPHPERLATPDESERGQ